ncbi:MAG: 4-hydroxythreonine-4-phosphate dehydrogenase PdxA, partial [Calditrichia bacterium]|nr:4-hydroxythreonine-4-phosphate dehydrogenase PdxA [Calditrichia bacterium]
AEPSAFYLTCRENVDKFIKKINNSLLIKFVPVFSNKSKLPEKPGTPSATGGLFSHTAVITAYEYFKNGDINCLATAPIDKKSLKIAGVKEVDHTQILKKVSKVQFVDTLFKVKNLNVYFYSKHIPFAQISSALNKNDLYNCVKRCIKYNKMLGLNKTGKPLAVAALNPHAGDNNRFGDEETKIIEPVIIKLQNEGENVSGPVPADSVFALANEGHFSSVLSLYHDQGHIAAKTLDFYRTVSLSPGMPFLRTSVDHGTAMNIAGQNKASAISMIHAVKAAVKYGGIYGRNWKIGGLSY